MEINECPRCGAPGYLEEYCVKSGDGERCYYRVIQYHCEGARGRSTLTRLAQ